MKIATALIIAFVCSSCGSGDTNTSYLAFEDNPPFNLEEASYQQWTAGTPEGGSGINVFINFSNIRQGVVFKEIYFRGKQTQVVTFPAVRVQYVGYFKNESKRDIIMDSNAINEAANRPPSKIPFQLYDDEAVISYEFNGKINYFRIQNLERKDPLAYPASNPNGDN